MRLYSFFSCQKYLQSHYLYFLQSESPPIFLLVSKPLMDPSWGKEQRARESTRFKAGWVGSRISKDRGEERARAQPAVSPSMNIWCGGLKPTLWTLKKKKSVTAEKCSEESGLPKLSAKVKRGDSSYSPRRLRGGDGGTWVCGGMARSTEWKVWCRHKFIMGKMEE